MTVPRGRLTGLPADLGLNARNALVVGVVALLAPGWPPWSTPPG
ncbi:hypothetical protein [Dactylosporangium sp. NPDC005555]